MAMVAVAAIGAVAQTAMAAKQAAVAEKNAAMQRLYEERDAEFRRQKIAFNLSQLENQALALRQDQDAAGVEARRTKAEQAAEGRRRRGSVQTEEAANGFLVNDYGHLSDPVEDAATSALLIADIDVQTQQYINDEDHRKAIQDRQFKLLLAENKAQQDWQQYALSATIASPVATPGNDVVSSLVTGASGVSKAWKEGGSKTWGSSGSTYKPVSSGFTTPMYG